MQDGLSKEQRIMRMMRKVLAQIIKDTTPSSKGMRHPLQDSTIQSIRECFILIAEREKELMEAQGKYLREKPYYADGS